MRSERCCNTSGTIFDCRPSTGDAAALLSKKATLKSVHLCLDTGVVLDGVPRLQGAGTTAERGGRAGGGAVVGRGCFTIVRRCESGNRRTGARTTRAAGEVDPTEAAIIHNSHTKKGRCLQRTASSNNEVAPSLSVI